LLINLSQAASGNYATGNLAQIICALVLLTLLTLLSWLSWPPALVARLKRSGAFDGKNFPFSSHFVAPGQAARGRF
jgi:hypothetical protein